MSLTVTTAGVLDTWPLLSVTDSVTSFGPRFAHVNAFGTTDIETIAQLSKEPLFTCAAVTLACPAPSRNTVTGCDTAVGKMASTTVTLPTHVAT